MWICCITPLIVFDAHAPIDPKIVHLVLTICNCVFPEHTISMQFVSVIASRCVDPCLNLRTRCFWICCCRDLFRFAHGAIFHPTGGAGEETNHLRPASTFDFIIFCFFLLSTTHICCLPADRKAWQSAGISPK